jgi:uroporphyrinogen-III synthase
MRRPEGRIVVLRPEPGASETVRHARELGLEAVAMPLFEVEPIAWEPPDSAGFDALLLTSANALRHGGAALTALRRLPVHAVGESTAEAARQAGFDIAGVGDSGVDGLLATIDPAVELLHLCGEDRRAPSAGGHSVTAIPVYRSRPMPAPDGLGQANDVLLIHSPRAGARVAELDLDRGSIALAAISPAAAGAAGEGWAAVEAAEEPTDDALLALAKRLCNNPGRP